MNAVEMLREDFQVSFAREFRIEKPILWMKFQYWLPDFFSAYVLTGSHMFCVRLSSVKTCFLFSTIADLIQIYFRIRPFCCPGTEKAFSFYISSIFIDWKRFFAPRNRDVINFFFIITLRLSIIVRKCKYRNLKSSRLFAIIKFSKKTACSFIAIYFLHP